MALHTSENDLTVHRWAEPPSVEAPAELRAAVGGHPLLAATLARRGILTAAAARAFLHPSHYTPAPPDDLPDMEAAADRVDHAVRAGERICVWGDFDVDGQTAASVLVGALRTLGAEVTYYIPNRKHESHGVNLPALARLIDAGMGLLLTCDTGIAAHEAVDFAHTRGVDVVITDHHTLPDVLPCAAAVVNPKRLAPTHPLYGMAGVGCAYKLVEALTGEEAAQHLDLVALGTVADVMPQTGDNRYMTQRGLEQLRRTERPGVQAMMERAELNSARLTEEHIGFQLAPRLNALGRLDDANKAVELLTTHDMGRARILAAELEGLNARRKQMTAQVYRAALAQVEQNPALLEYAALVLAHPTWPAGIVGIVANRLVERYGRPAVLIAAPPGQPARGSARSVEGCDITAAIAAQAGMLHGFGGHQAAAGLGIDADRIDDFRRALSRTLRAQCGEAIGEAPTLQIDGYLPWDALTLDLVADFERLAPFGPGNPALTLVTQGLTVANDRVIGRMGEHRRLVVTDEAGAAQEVLWWRGAGEPLPPGRFDLAYRVRASDYRGTPQVEVVWVDARPLDAPPPAVTLEAGMEVVDYRGAPEMLARVRAEEDVLVWAEAAPEVGGVSREALAPAQRLAVWTAPPGPAELRAALDAVAPEVVYLFGVDPGLDKPAAFIKRLTGLVRYALEARDGEVRISHLAAAMAHCEETVRAGVAWLAARGDVAVAAESSGVWDLAPEGERGDPAPAMARLKGLLEETAAYRAHFLRADKDALV